MKHSLQTFLHHSLLIVSMTCSVTPYCDGTSSTISLLSGRNAHSDARSRFCILQASKWFVCSLPDEFKFKKSFFCLTLYHYCFSTSTSHVRCQQLQWSPMQMRSFQTSHALCMHMKLFLKNYFDVFLLLKIIEAF